MTHKRLSCAKNHYLYNKISAAYETLILKRQINKKHRSALFIVLLQITGPLLSNHK